MSDKDYKVGDKVRFNVLYRPTDAEASKWGVPTQFSGDGEIVNTREGIATSADIEVEYSKATGKPTGRDWYVRHEILVEGVDYVE